MRRIKLPILLLALTLFLISFCPAAIFSQEMEGKGGSGLDADTNYDIYYEVNTYEVDVVKNVRIVDLIELGETTFLEITGTSLGAKGKRGYILFTNIKAILPSVQITPERSLFKTSE